MSVRQVNLHHNRQLLSILMNPRILMCFTSISAIRSENKTRKRLQWQQDIQIQQLNLRRSSQLLIRKFQSLMSWLSMSHQVTWALTALSISFSNYTKTMRQACMHQGQIVQRILMLPSNKEQISIIAGVVTMPQR